MMFVYTLIDPRSGEVRYVGQTCNTPHRRLRKHITPSNLTGGSHRGRWICSLLRAGVEPMINIIERCTSVAELYDSERFWIRYYLSIGAKLTNGTPGGKGGGRHTPETKAKISASLRGKPKSEEHRRKTGLASCGRVASPATRAKLSRLKSAPRMPLDESWRITISRAKGGRAFVDQYGRRYETQNGASRELSINLGHINEVLHGIRGQVEGYVFSFID